MSKFFEAEAPHHHAALKKAPQKDQVAENQKQIDALHKQTDVYLTRVHKLALAGVTAASAAKAGENSASSATASSSSSSSSSLIPLTPAERLAMGQEIYRVGNIHPSVGKHLLEKLKDWINDKAIPDYKKSFDEIVTDCRTGKKPPSMIKKPPVKKPKPPHHHPHPVMPGPFPFPFPIAPPSLGGSDDDSDYDDDMYENVALQQHMVAKSAHVAQLRSCCRRPPKKEQPESNINVDEECERACEDEMFDGDDSEYFFDDAKLVEQLSAHVKKWFAFCSEISRVYGMIKLAQQPGSNNAPFTPVTIGVLLYCHHFFKEVRNLFLRRLRIVRQHVDYEKTQELSQLRRVVTQLAAADSHRFSRDFLKQYQVSMVACYHQDVSKMTSSFGLKHFLEERYYLERKLLEQLITTSKQNHERVLRRYSDEVVEKITSKRKGWLSRVVLFVVQQKAKGHLSDALQEWNCLRCCAQFLFFPDLSEKKK